MLKIRGRSSWRWDSSSSLGLGVDAIVGLGGAGGVINLKDPHGVKTEFRYGYGGIGAGVGMKFSISTPASGTVDAGSLHILDSFRGTELEAKDLVGCCMIGEASAGVFHGVEGYAMVLGIPPQKLQNEMATGLIQLAVNISGGQIAGDVMFDIMKKTGWLESNAKAILYIGGTTKGINVGAGVLGSVGYLWQGPVKPANMPVIEYTPHEELSPGRSWNTEKDTLAFIEIPGDILFAFNDSTLKPTAAQELHKAGAKLQSHQGRRVDINGYTDSIGSDRYNDGLSTKRATAVKQWLVSNGYINSAKVSIRGLGERFPVAPNKTSAGRDNPGGRARNRRVEIIVWRS